MAKNDVYIRAAAGSVFVLLMVAATMYGPVSLLVISVVISAICLKEFLEVRKLQDMVNYGFVHLINLLWLATVAEKALPFSFSLTKAIWPLTSGLTLLFFTIQLFRKGPAIITTVTNTVFSLCYISMPFVAFLKFSFQDLPDYNWQKPLFVMVLVWSSDTFAYVAGRLFGRTYLFPALSPKKTVEGWIGGTILAGVAGAIMSYFWPFIGITNGIVLGVLVSIFGTAGDLFESALKRQAGVKDSGNIIPGHGGLLDRFDAFLIAAIVVAAWYQLVGL